MGFCYIKVLREPCAMVHSNSHSCLTCSGPRFAHKP